MNVDEVIKNHKRWCNCTPKWEAGEFGEELVCQNERSLLWWPMVEHSLSQAQSFALFYSLPMYYDSDGDSVNNMLLKLGYKTIDSTNFQEAYNAILKQFEHELWQDNVGKQLLGRVLDND